MLFKMALREIKKISRFHFFFLLSLSFGMTGIIIVKNFKFSIEKTIGQKSKKFLGADLALSLITPFKKDELKKIRSFFDEEIKISESIELLTMIKAGEKARLVQLKAVDSLYPFYGSMKLKNKGTYKPGKDIQGDGVIIQSELKDQLKLKNLDFLGIGQTRFKITDLLIDDIGQNFMGGSFVPRVYLSLDSLKKTKLIKFGSTIRYYYLLKLEEDFSLEKVNSFLKENFPEKNIRVVTPQRKGQRMGRGVNYLSDFLGLTALISLLLAVSANFYLYRNYLFNRKKDMAVLKAMGFSRVKIFTIYFYHLLLLGVMAGALSFLMAAPLVLFVNYAVQNYTPLQIVIQISWKSFFYGSFICMASNALCALPLIIPKLDSSITSLHASKFRQRYSQKKEMILFIPWAIFFVLISVDLSSSYRNGPLFCLFIFISLLLTDRMGIAILNGLGRARLRGHIIFKLASKNMTRFKTETLISLMVLVLLSSMLTLIPQLNHIMVEELSELSRGKTPHFFLIDIQKDQIADLKKFCEENNVQLAGPSPMVKAKLRTLNGKPFEQYSVNKKSKTREAERDAFLRNRPVNLSYKEKLYNDEKIVKGVPFEKMSSEEQLPGISLEKRYAKRLKIKIGDELGMSILGLPLKGKVESFRKVNWANLKPNFFILFRKGVLESYPQTFLATTFHQKDKRPYGFQMKLLDKFPNISSINLKRNIEKTRSIFNDIVLSFRTMTFVCLFVGIFVIWTIFQNQVEQRIPDYNLLKTLGFSPNHLKKIGMTELGLLIAFAGLFGIFVGYFLSYALVSIFFENMNKGWSFYPWAFLPALLSKSLIAFLVYRFLFKKVIEEKAPNELLKGY